MFFISEVSSNHSQKIDRALQFIDQSAEAGCDAVKFQLFKVEQLFSKEILKLYEKEIRLVGETENQPFEKPLHNIYEKELCISPIPSLAIHCTNINSIFGLSPNVDWKKLWNENK